MVILETQPCAVCHKVSQIKLEDAKVRRWMAGEHVQDVWPEKTAMERETMISGVCSQEHWDKLWGDNE